MGLRLAREGHGQTLMEKAMEKHEASAAPMSSSGLVAGAVGAPRERNSQLVCAFKAPLPVLTVPLPSVRFPCQVALAWLSAVGILNSLPRQDSLPAAAAIRVHGPVARAWPLLAGCDA